jgi:hypothetical protein
MRSSIRFCPSVDLKNSLTSSPVNIVLLDIDFRVLSVLKPINVIASPKLINEIASLHALTVLTGMSIYKFGKTIIAITAHPRKVECRTFKLIPLKPLSSFIPSKMYSITSNSIKKKAAIDTYNNHFPGALIIGVSLNTDKIIKPMPTTFVNVVVKRFPPYILFGLWEM